MGKFIAIANQKGGVGKTTTAINLAAALSMAGRTCLIIDLDPQGNATSGLGIDKKPHEGSHLLLTNTARAIEAIVHSPIARLDLIPSTTTLAEAETELAPMPDRVLRLRAAKRDLGQRYDVVVIDCPPSVGFFPSNALSCCDAVLVPIQCEYYAMEGLTQILSGIGTIKARLNPQLRLAGILLTMFEPSTFAREVVSEVKGHFGDLVYKTRIPRDIALAEAPSHGLPIFQYDPRSRGARAYIELAKEIMRNEQG